MNLRNLPSELSQASRKILELKYVKNLRQALRHEDEETLQAIKELTHRRAKARQHASKRLYPDQDIKQDDTGHYYIFNEDSPHTTCTDCQQKFTEGEKVYLTNYFHNQDVITPFPYCQNCLKQHLVQKYL